MENIVNVKDFSEYPGLRHCSISDDSGEEFYHKVLNNAFKLAYENKKKIKINLDSTAGYAPSFLDEAFGNLVYDFGLETVQKNVIIISEEEPDLKDMILNETYKQWQKRREKNDTPRKTREHEPWFRLVNGKITKING